MNSTAYIRPLLLVNGLAEGLYMAFGELCRAGLSLGACLIAVPSGRMVPKVAPGKERGLMNGFLETKESLQDGVLLLRKLDHLGADCY